MIPRRRQKSRSRLQTHGYRAHHTRGQAQTQRPAELQSNRNRRRSQRACLCRRRLRTKLGSRIRRKPEIRQELRRPGNGDGKFNTCHGIALDTRGEKPLLLICDRANHRLQHFDLDGNFVAVITVDPGHLPCAVSFHGKNVAVAELDGRVAIIDGTNKVVSVLGENPNPKQRGNFGVPPADWTRRNLQRPARRLLRQGWESLRRRLESLGPDQQDDEGSRPGEG